MAGQVHHSIRKSRTAMTHSHVLAFIFRLCNYGNNDDNDENKGKDTYDEEELNDAWCEFFPPGMMNVWYFHRRVVVMVRGHGLACHDLDMYENSLFPDVEIINQM